jgi:hypothetical protein
MTVRLGIKLFICVVVLVIGTAAFKVEQREYRKKQLENFNHPRNLAMGGWFDIHLEPQFPSPPDPRPIDPESGERMS